MSFNYTKTSNPAFSSKLWRKSSSSQYKMSVSGIIIKTFFCLSIIVAVIWYVGILHNNGTEIKYLRYIGIFGTILISSIIYFFKYWAPFLVIAYSVCKGLLLGTVFIYTKTNHPDLPYQAIIITIISFFIVLFLYQTRIIKVTHKFRSVLITVITTIFMVYLISWILRYFNITSFIFGTSWLAIGFNMIAAVSASLSLLLDFSYIEHKKNYASKRQEWLATYGLLVTLIWLYVEVIRLMRKLAIRF